MNESIKKINNVYDSYAGTADLELEFRIKKNFSGKDILKFLDNLQQGGYSGRGKGTNLTAAEWTINCITKCRGQSSLAQFGCSDVYQINFSPDETNQDSEDSMFRQINKYTKRKLMRPYVFYISKGSNVPIKMAISEEASNDDIVAETCDIVRMKNRLSIYTPAIKNWRIDITLVKTLNHIKKFDTSMLRQHVDGLFGRREERTQKISDAIKYFCGCVSKAVYDNIEFELEYISSAKQGSIMENEAPSKKDMERLFSFLKKFMIGRKKMGGATMRYFETKPKYVTGGCIPCVLGGEAKADSANLAESVEAPWVNMESGDLSTQDILSEIAKAIRKSGQVGKHGHPRSLKQISQQVISMTLHNLYYIIMPNIKNFYISPKIDGLRTVLYITQGGTYALSNELKKLDIISPTNTSIIVDTEYLDGKFYIFDVLRTKDGPVADENYESRIKYIDEIAKLDDCLVKKPIFALDAKSSWKKIIRDMLKKKYPYETDGLIFTDGKGGGYKESTARNPKVFKWKPAKYLSIDFMSRDGYLYSGVNDDVAEKILTLGGGEYISAKFEPTYVPLLCRRIDGGVKQAESKSTGLTDSIHESLDNICKFDSDDPGKIIELIWDDKKCDWEQLRVRDDRTDFGNNMKIADLTWHSIFWPITSVMLTGGKKINHTREAEAEIENFAGRRMEIYRDYIDEMKNKMTDATDTVVNIGTIYPYLNMMTENNGIKHLYYVVADGFSALDIIRQKYDYRFIKQEGVGERKGVDIRVLKVADYKAFLKKGEVGDNAIVMSMHPTSEQKKCLSGKTS